MGKKNVDGSGGIRTHAPEETGALNQRLGPLGHATVHTLTSYLEYNWFSYYWQKAKKTKSSMTTMFTSL